MIRKIRNTGRAIDVSDPLDDHEAALRGVPHLVAVYLHGSYGTAAQTPLSDVDLALLFADGHAPTSEEHVQLIGLVTGTLREDDVSVTVLNRAPLAFQHRILARGRLLVLTDEIAHADFVERTITRYSDFAIDEARFVEEYDRALVEAYGHGAG